MNQHDRLLFISHGRLGSIKSNGSEEWYFEPEITGQASWGWGPLFSDGRRVILASYADKQTWTGVVESRLWLYDLDDNRIVRELATQNKPAPFMVCTGLLPGEERILTGPVIDGIQRVWTMKLDGSDPVEVTVAADGFSYCIQLSPDHRRLAFHATMIPDRPGYRIITTDLDCGDRVEVAGSPEHLYFGPVWSPNGEWLAYLDCEHETDPGHDWANLCLGRPDGSEHRVITEGQRHWFGTSYGGPDTRGGGSNMTSWSRGGRTLTFTRAEPGSRTAWPFQEQRPDTDHFNRDYYPEEACGGTAICVLDPYSGVVKDLIPYQPNVWNFRAVWSPDGSRLAFCRSEVGQPSGLWVADADGGNARRLTYGFDGRGADHPVWVTHA